MAANIYATEHSGHLLPPVDNKSGFQQWMMNKDYFTLLGEEKPESPAN